MIYIHLFILVSLSLSSKSQALEFDATGSQKTVSVIETTSGGKKCFILNIYSSPVLYNNEKIFPLIVIKAFSDSFEKRVISPVIATKFDELQDRITKNLYADLFYNITNFKTYSNIAGKAEYQFLYEDLVLKTIKGLYLFKGAVLIQFFNVLQYHQISPGQSNMTIINTLAPTVSYNFDPKYIKDSIPMPDYKTEADRIAYSKINLIAKKDETYTFCRLMIPGFDDLSHRTELFEYKSSTGIVGFKSSYVLSSKNKAAVSLGAQYTEEYFNFKFKAIINL